MFDLAGRVALVTGAGQGVGRSLSLALASQGAAVAVNDLDQDRAASTVAAIESAGGKAVAVAADVTDPGAVGVMAAEVSGGLGPVDILVNNAGIPSGRFPLKPFRETTPADWQPFVDLNLYGVLFCTHAVLGPMIDRGWGRIITIISDAALTGEPKIALYAAAKAAAAGFTRSLAKEVGSAGVTCNCVSLGMISPPGYSPERLAQKATLYPVGRVGTTDDPAGAVVWLASEEAAWVTGQTVAVNGGYTM